MAIKWEEFNNRNIDKFQITCECLGITEEGQIKYGIVWSDERDKWLMINFVTGKGRFYDSVERAMNSITRSKKCQS
jgi:hypothetical protein